MSKVRVESGVAMPPKQRGPKPKYPFATMEVDDSFKVPPYKLASVRSLASRHSVDGKEFAVRKESKKPPRWRCWRIR